MHEDAPAPLQVLSNLASPACFFQSNHRVEQALCQATLRERQLLQSGESRVGWHVHNTHVFAIPLSGFGPVVPVSKDETLPGAHPSVVGIDANQMEELRRLVDQGRIVLARWDHHAREYNAALSPEGNVLPVADLLRSKLMKTETGRAKYDDSADEGGKGPYYLYVLRQLKMRRRGVDDFDAGDSCYYDWAWGLFMLLFFVLFFVIVFWAWGRVDGSDRHDRVEKGDGRHAPLMHDW